MHQDEEMLRQEFTYSASYLQQIRRMNELRKQSVQDSANYGGGSVPFGFIIAGEKGKSKHYQVYEPHAALIRWLFKRYRALNGNLAKLRHEVLHMQFAFPPFADVGTIPHVSLHFVDGVGYPLRSRGSLVSILTNVAYIGHYLFGGMMQQHTHDAIVDTDDFMYAYNRLSPIKLNGEKNESKPTLPRTFGISCQALLENILTNNGRTMYVSRARQVYETKKSDIPGSVTSTQVRIDMIDSAFTNQLIHVLMVLEDRHRQGLSDSLYEQLEVLQQETQDEVISLATTLENINKAISGWELDKQSCRETGNLNGLNAANIQLAKLYADRDDIKLQMQAKETEENDIIESMDLTQQVIENWQALPFDVQRQYTQLIVESADIAEVSPHFMRIDITLKAPLSTTMRGYMFRNKGSKAVWTDAEIETVKQMYPTADRLEVLQALPTHTWNSIMRIASMHDVARKTMLDTSDMGMNTAYADIQFRQSIKGELYFFPPMQQLQDGYTVWKIDAASVYGEMFTDMVSNDVTRKCGVNPGWSPSL